MFKKRTGRAAAVLLALSIMTTGFSAISANAAGAVALRQYPYITDTNGSQLKITGESMYVIKNNSAYLVEIAALNGSITIPARLGGKNVAGVSTDFRVSGYATNVSIDTTKLDTVSYNETIKGVLQKVPDLRSINNETVVFGDSSNLKINTNASDSVKKVLAALNCEDNEAVCAAMSNRLSTIVRTQTQNCYNDFDKIKALHDWVINQVNYGSGSCISRSYADWSVFMNPEHLAICDGYTRAFTLLLQAAGFEAYYEGFGNHAATIVKLYGNYYHIDTTWDDTNGGICYDHFLKGDATYRQSHQLSSSYVHAADEIEIKDGSTRLYVVRFPSTFYKRWNNPNMDMRCYSDFNWQ